MIEERGGRILSQNDAGIKKWRRGILIITTTLAILTVEIEVILLLLFLMKLVLLKVPHVVHYLLILLLMLLIHVVRRVDLVVVGPVHHHHRVHRVRVLHRLLAVQSSPVVASEILKYLAKSMLNNILMTS